MITGQLRGDTLETLRAAAQQLVEAWASLAGASPTTTSTHLAGANDAARPGENKEQS